MLITEVPKGVSRIITGVNLTTNGRSHLTGTKLQEEDMVLFLNILKTVPDMWVPSGNIHTTEEGVETLLNEHFYYVANFRLEDGDLKCDIAVPDQCKIKVDTVKYFPVYRSESSIDADDNKKVVVYFKTIGWMEV